MNKYSITSNRVKLFKHLKKLQVIQRGIQAPILLHLSLTNKCDSNCIHCCFSEREKNLSLPFDLAVKAIEKR